MLNRWSDTLASPLSSSDFKPSVNVINRQVETGPGLECATIFCHLPACVGTPLCENVNSKRIPATSLTDRQIDCPSGINCAPGPECTADLCDLLECADTEICTSSQDRKRNADTDIIPPVCDICIVGANGVPVCGCATAGGGPERRDTEKVCPLFCITTKNDGTLCGCAAEEYEDSLHEDKLKF